VRDWKPYLVKSLLNRASKLARAKRRRAILESSFDSEAVQWAAPEPPSRMAGLTLSELRLGNSDRRLLTQLAAFNGNVLNLAKHLGLHRNTIHRWLRQIRRTRSLFEIESALLARHPPEAGKRSDLEAVISRPGASAREILRSQVILDLLDGLTYEQILRRRRTSASTIARWRERFAKHGMAGLKARHLGRKPKRRTTRPQDPH